MGSLRDALIYSPSAAPERETVYADAGYQGAEKRAPKRGRRWFIAAKRGSVKAMPEGKLKDAVRAKVEHPFRVVKRQFDYPRWAPDSICKTLRGIRWFCCMG